MDVRETPLVMSCCLYVTCMHDVKRPFLRMEIEWEKSETHDNRMLRLEREDGLYWHYLHFTDYF